MYLKRKDEYVLYLQVKGYGLFCNDIIFNESKLFCFLLFFFFFQKYVLNVFASKKVKYFVFFSWNCDQTKIDHVLFTRSKLSILFLNLSY